MIKFRLSEKFRSVTQVALLYRIAPHMRLIAASIDPQKKCIIRMYVDRPADEADHDMLRAVLDDIASAIPIATISDYSCEIVKTQEPMSKLDRLYGSLYERHEKYLG